MKFSVEVEKPSSVVRKLTVKVPADEVKNKFNRGLASIQRTAKLKGFRPGHAPISIIKEYYGHDLRHRVYHDLIDESFSLAVKEQQLRTIGSPKIDASEHKTGEGTHDHSASEDRDFTYVATVEVFPELELKNYTGVSINRDEVQVTDEDVNQTVERMRDSRAELIPVKEGLTLADGTQSTRPIQKGDFVDLQVSGGLIVDGVFQSREDMEGTRLVEVGGNQWVPGFEEQLVGLRRGESKTFRLTFPKDYPQADLADREAEFSVQIHEVKEKNLPALDEEFAKQMGFESLLDLRTKAREMVQQRLTEESDRKAKNDLLNAIIEKNPFEIPQGLVERQAQALIEDWAQELKAQGVSDQEIRSTVSASIEFFKKRAEGQVRASLVLEAIAAKESIVVKPEEIDSEIKRFSESMNIGEADLWGYYKKNPGRLADLEFRLRQERTIGFLLDKAKVKTVPPTVK